MALLRLRGLVKHVVPTTVNAVGKREGGFGFVRVDGIAEGDLPADQPSPIGVDHFLHVRDVPEFTRIEDALNCRVVFTPVEHPRGPRATEAEVER